VREGGAASRPIGAASRPIGAVSCLIALAALLPGCAEDPASRRAGGPRVVSVLGAGSDRATGFAVASDRVVTVAHALEGTAMVRVRTGRVAHRARVLRVDRRADLALLAVSGLGGSNPGTATAAGDDRVRVIVLRDGRRATRKATVRRAIDARVSAPGGRRPVRRAALELEARLRAGDSGAPVVSEDGAVAGVLFARSRNHAGTAYAVSAAPLDALLDAERRVVAPDEG
jgi:S1-C subfamily serine protease